MIYCNVCGVLRYNPENIFKCSVNNCNHHICQTCIFKKTPRETKWSFCSGTKNHRILNANGDRSIYSGYCDKYTYILCPDHYGGESWCEFKSKCTVWPSDYKPERIEPDKSKCSVCMDMQEGVTTFGNKSKQIVLMKKYGLYKKRKF